jgi:hypothetical protein
MHQYKKRYIKFFEKMTSQEAMKIFGIEIVHDSNELKNLYRNLSLKNHPDKGGNLEKMQDINQAYDILKQIRSSSKSSFNWEDINKKWRDINKYQYPIMESIFEEEFDEKGILKYLQQFVQEELTITILKKDKNKISDHEWTSSFLTFTANVKIHNNDNTIVFYVSYSISYNFNHGTGLTYDNIDEKDILYNVDITSDIYYNNRKQKLGKRDYKWNVGHKIIASYEEVFPKVKLNKIFSGHGKQTFRKADFYQGLKRELNTTFDNDLIFIYPFGKDVKFYLVMYRSVFNRYPVYSWNVLQAIDPITSKYHHPALRLPYRSMPETEESLRKVIKINHELVKITKQKHLNPIEDSKELHKIVVDLIEELFLENY